MAAKKLRVKGRRWKKVKLSLSTDIGPKAPKKADPAMVNTLVEGVESNELNEAFRTAAKGIAQDTLCGYVVVGAIEASGSGFRLNSYVYGAKEQQVVALESQEFDANLASALVQAARFAKAVEITVNQFPTDKALVGQTFRTVKPKATPPAPVVIASKTPATVKPRTQPKATEPKPVRRRPRARRNPLEESVVEPAPVRRRTKWYKSWWFWTITGTAVAVGAGVGGYYLFREEPNANEFMLKVEW